MKKSKIILVTFIDKDVDSPTYGEELVSHGINSETLEDVILPSEPFSFIHCHYDSELGEYVLNDD